MPIQLKTKEYLIYGGLSLFLLLSTVLYVFEFRQFEQLLHTRLFLIISTAAGALIGLLLAWYFRKNATDLTEKIQIFVFFIAISTVFTPLWASISNRLLSFYPVKEVDVEFWEANAFYASIGGPIVGEEVKPSGVYTFIFVDGQLMRLKSKDYLYPGKERGDTVQLQMQKGFWGMTYLIRQDY
ncbi:MAG: hypothetical protein MRY78_05005 [Saprospiraceae bacterium]|nr:hypothetical protein [Saprospiraceae bacterium]